MAQTYHISALMASPGIGRLSGQDTTGYP